MNTASFPILMSERVALRPLSLDDHQAIFDLRSDPNNNKFLNRPQCVTTEDAKNFINAVNENIKKGNSYYWGITLTETKQLIGAICLFDITHDTKSCEMGYELMMPFQGQGIMQEALQTVINFVFQTLKLKKIIAHTHPENLKSTNLLLKFNFIKSIETNKENTNLTVFTLTQ